MQPSELPNLKDGELIEKIDKSQLTPLYQTDHEHIYVRDPEDDEDGYYAEMCSVEGCNLGRLIAK